MTTLEIEANIPHNGALALVPSLGRYGLTARQSEQGTSIEPADDDGQADAEYQAVLKDPAAWVHTLAWANAEAKRRACEAGRTAWLLGESADRKRIGAIRAGCGAKDCKRCKHVRAREVKARIDELFDARPCVMLTLTLRQNWLNKYEAWRIIGLAWRRCWERLVRRVPWLLMEPGQACLNIGKRVRTAVRPPGKEFKACLSSKDDCQCPEAVIGTKGFRKVSAKQRIPQAWVKEAHGSGFPHMHVAIGVARLYEYFDPNGEPVYKSGYGMLKEEWKAAVLWVTKGLSAGGWVYISGPKKDHQTPGRYMAQYVTAEKHAIPEEIRAMLWGERTRLFGCTGRKRHIKSIEERDAEAERASWVWEMFKGTAEETAEDKIAAAMLSAMEEDAAKVEPWSEYTVYSGQELRIKEFVGGQEREFRPVFTEENGIHWLETRADPPPD